MEVIVSTTIQLERITPLNKQPLLSTGYVLYWMQSAQRIAYNHALIYAIEQANAVNADLVVYFALTDNFPEANARHYYFMLEGLQELNREFTNLKIRFIVEHADPTQGVVKIAQNARLLVGDFGYLKIERFWRKTIANNVSCAFVQIETNLIVPVTIASIKEEYSAATLRRKINKHLPNFLVAPTMPPYLGRSLTSLEVNNQLILDNLNTIVSNLNVDKKVAPSAYFQGGYLTAKKLLKLFITEKLPAYANFRNDPSQNYASDLSPYLHFGQISPLEIALSISENLKVNSQLQESSNSFLEELIVRRELAFNFVYYNLNYDNYNSLPNWAQQTLANHKEDQRSYVYLLEELELGKTHDEYWNAAQTQLVKTGKMHGYLRMYWGKKIIEWSSTPEIAYQTALYLNNKYSLDGRDANAFAGIAWCFGKHDRPWTERSIFGNIRYMNKQGLERKFKMRPYVEKIQSL